MSKTISILREVFRQKGFQVASILIFNSVSWYFPLFILFTDEINQLNLGYVPLILVFGFHYLAIASSAFLGNHLAEKIGRNKLLSIWIILGACATTLMLLISSSNLPVICAISIILGVSLGLGFPSCLAYFEDNLTSDRRGLIGGVTFALTFVAITIAGILATLAGFSNSIIGFSLWRLIGLFLFFFLKTEDNHLQTNLQTKISYLNIIRERSFYLYFVPWTVFCVINFFQAPFFDTQLQQQYLNTNLSYIVALGEFGIGGISMLVGGFLSDRIGRKRLIIVAYALVGVGYALLSLASDNELVFYSYVLLDGIAWGIFFLMFLLIIWGDLAQSRAKNRYYLIGVMPFIIASYITPIVRPYVGHIELFTAFSFASFFLFIAVIPLMVAPETLTEKVMKDQDLKSYAEKAIKQVKKETEKPQRKKAEKSESKDKENQEEAKKSSEYEQARKLAEKYY
jgi:MFS family permease